MAHVLEKDVESKKKMFTLQTWRLGSAREKSLTLNSCFQTQFLSLHILTCSPDISIVQKMNTWQLPHKLFHSFSLVLVTFIFRSTTGNTLPLPERKDMKRLRDKKAAAQTRTVRHDYFNGTKPTLIFLTCIKQRPEHVGEETYDFSAKTWASF